jgi:MoaA/NifB/PqqE/SkfB family radical SAM enzyme
MARGDLRLGCDECAHHIDDGRRGDSIAPHYDHIVPELGDRQGPRLIDFALSSTCNLQCVMCNGELSSAIRVQREGRARRPSAYDDRFFDELRAFLPTLRTAVFKGGEPFLARETRRVWDDLLELAPGCSVSVTTNGTVMSPDVERYVRDLRMHVVVSIDGASPEANEAIRVGTDHQQVLANIHRFVELTAEVGSSVSLSFCLMTVNWQELAPLLDLAEGLGVSVDVIWVNQPHRFDLLELPEKELDEVRRGLAAQDRPGRFARCSATFRAVLDRIDARLLGPVAVPVSVGLRRQVGGTIDSLAAELRAWSGVDPVVVRCDADVIAHVEGSAWATWMNTGAWIGRSRHEILGMLWDATGSNATYDVVHRSDGVDQVSVTLAGGTWEGAIRALLTSDHRGNAVLIAPAAEPPDDRLDSREGRAPRPR